MTKILISSCLLGYKVRYDGKDNLQNHLRLNQWFKEGKVIAICPEMAGGLTTPRPPSEIEFGKTGVDILEGNAKIKTNENLNVSQQYLLGAHKALQLTQVHRIKVAILKARSPSCGFKHIYDGTFSKKITEGIGVTAALLYQNNIQIFDETEIDKALDTAESIESNS